jgi:hypothetical protein
VEQSVTKLLSIASEPIAGPFSATDALSGWGRLGQELAEALTLKNGFYAYESALLVRPLSNIQAPLGLLEWNAPKLWKADYDEDIGDALFFAEDVFGGQYCIRYTKIFAFDPETGLFDEMSSSLGSWASEVMADYQFRTGYPLAHTWQMQNEPLRPGMRLVPKSPFVCGGKHEVENLYSVADLKGMSFRASIANQIRDLPDGAEITLKAAPSSET